MTTNEYGYPVFTLKTKHGDIAVTVRDKTPKQDGRGYTDTRPESIRLDADLLKINGVECEVHSSFSIYQIVDEPQRGWFAHTQYGMRRAGSFSSSVTDQARNIINTYAVQAYSQVTSDMWVQARRANIEGQVRSLRDKANGLREEAHQVEDQASALEKTIP